MEDLKQILEGLGYTNLKDRGREWSTRPLYRESDNDTALSINKKTGDWYDFVICKGGVFQDLCELSLNKPLTEELRTKILSLEFVQQQNNEVEVPIKRVFNKSILLNLIKDNKYWNNRGISDEILEDFQGGVAINGKMRNRWVFPVLNEKNELIGFNGRYIYNSVYAPRWKILGQKLDWVFPTIHYKNIEKSKQVIICESAGDILALKQAGIENTLSSFGVKLYPSIVKFLLKSNVNRIIIALNNDSLKNNVGNRAAQQFKKSLENYFDIHQVEIALPPKKDFGEMNADEIIEWKKEFNV